MENRGENKQPVTETQNESNSYRKRISLYSSWTRECRRSGTFCDVEVFASPQAPGQPPIHAHKVILATSSHFFRAQLVMDDDNNKIYVPGVTRSAVEMLIDYIYAGELKYIEKKTRKMTVKKILDLKQAATVLMFDEVSLLCQTQLLTQSPICLDNCVEMLCYAFQLHTGCQKTVFMENCLKFILQNLSKVLHSCKEEFCDLPYDILQFIIVRGLSTYFVTSIVEDLISGVAIWLKYRAIERQIHMFGLLQNFPLKECQLLLRKAFIQDVEEEFKILFFEPLSKYLMSAIVNDGPSSSSSSTTPRNFDSPSKPKDNYPLLSSSENASIRIENSSSGHSRMKKRSDPMSMGPPPQPEIKRMRSNNFNSNHEDDCIITSSTVTESSVNSTQTSTYLSSREGSTIHEFDGIIYFIADVGSNDDRKEQQLWSYNLNNDEYQELASIDPSWPVKNTVAYYQQNIFVLGGRDPTMTKIFSSDVRVFDLKTKNWWVSTDGVPQMKRGRIDFEAVILNGDLYAVGGARATIHTNPSREAIICVERLTGCPDANGNDPPQMEWCPIQFKMGTRYDYGTAVFQGKIYTAGGGVEKTKNYFDATTHVECYDPGFDVWTTIEPMAQPRTAVCLVATSKYLYAIGGYGKTSASHNSVEIYSPTQKKWFPGPDMNKRRQFASGIYWKAKNAIFVFGGDRYKNLGPMAKPTIEKLDLATKKWELVGKLKREGNYWSVAFQ